MNIFATGCTGYIGSHTCVEFLNASDKYNIIGLDNFSNSQPEVLDKIFELTTKRIKFYEGNMLDEKLLEKIFSENKIDMVIDFAAYKSVGDSVENPIDYYINNVSSVLTLLKVMNKYDVKSFLFSSSTTVYGDAKIMPITEKYETGNTTNPYGTSKFYVENILKDLNKSDESFNICILRYFNPVGAHKSGLIGEEPQGIPANLMPYICNVAVGKLEQLSVYGNDYDTKDGTGIRDYIHIVDLAIAHLKAVEKLEKERSGVHIYNIGTGNGYSVLEIIETFERVNNLKLNYKIAPRRAGDVASCYADCSFAKEEIGFVSTHSLEEMCKDSYEFYKKTKNNK